MGEAWEFIDESGTFRLKNAENYSYLYFPVAGEDGVRSSVTPNLGGDSKLDQNTFLLEPVSAESLHTMRSSRNFWCRVEGLGCWSVTGMSAWQQAEKFTAGQDESEVTAGLLWHKASRSSRKYGLRGAVTSFAAVEEPLEIMYVEITNISEETIVFTPTAAVPLYARSADNIRDHRHVTSLLHRIVTREAGVEVTPTLSFDERGHGINQMTYFVHGFDGEGRTPLEFFPVTEDFLGEGGTFERPRAVLENRKGVPAGTASAGFEAMGGLRFEEASLKPGETAVYTIVLGAVNAVRKGNGCIEHLTENYRTGERTQAELTRVKEYWKKKVSVVFHTGDKVWDGFLRWVGFQPVLRRIYGCSFLPHHDYGRGGRGWRDLWQDCLALLVMDTAGVRGMLLNHFGGVRMDGANATIIGSRPGEFIADRNNIARVWMDHGVWPLMTTKLYIDQTGDLELLDQEVSYFKDGQARRGRGRDKAWDETCGPFQLTEDGRVYTGTVLEHLLVQNLTAFYEVGEHNHMLLRGADWNDALDMASERGESVAFTNAYAGNLRDLAALAEDYGARTHSRTVLLARELLPLLTPDPEVYDNPEAKRRLLEEYTSGCVHSVSGERKKVSVEELALGLRRMADWIQEHIRRTEWVGDTEGGGWYNSYYDNHGRRVEGVFDGGVRMMLTGQVFAVMSGTAGEDEVLRIVESADRYLYRPDTGGYCLNTDFKEVKTDLGRMFGFAYGEKENGAVFSHMAVMYANALYQRGFAAEGFKALNALEKQAVNFEVSRIYPGIPEYFNSRGRGMYHYLTGAASWYILTAVTQMYGVRGSRGNLVIEPKLLEEQFDGNGRAELSLPFAGKRLRVIYENPGRKEYGEYSIAAVRLDGNRICTAPETGGKVCISRDMLSGLSGGTEHILTVRLAGAEGGV